MLRPYTARITYGFVFWKKETHQKNTFVPLSKNPYHQCFVKYQLLSIFFLSFHGRIHGFLKVGVLSLIFGFQSDVLTLKMRYLYLLLVNFSDERGGGVFPTPKIPPLWIRNCLPKGIDNLKKSLKWKAVTWIELKSLLSKKHAKEYNQIIQLNVIQQEASKSLNCSPGCTR